MRKLDCLIIHTPKFNNYYKPVGQFMWVNYMPLGLLGIADYLHRNRMRCSVLHQGVEKMNRLSWQLEESLSSVSVPVIALSLHWHYQAYDVIESCKKIREIHPGAYIVVGGSTASFFHEEIVRDFNCVDGVVRGDGELPLLEVVRKIKKGDRNLSGVPNLTWRNGEGRVVTNETTYCADEKML
ncbi:MAG TPA: cobalamin-dependent protein, partial [Desulfatiglandales bacterium]|nr:cobalamin-dependent protein [Desulfatiglandales bacterium]